MNLFDHLTKTIKPIKSSKSSKQPINIYVCGSTVHAISHLGHARTYSIFDSIRKFLISQGYVVNYGMNVTDIDDKINTKVRALYYYNLIKSLNKLNYVAEINKEVQNYFESNRLDKIEPNIFNTILTKFDTLLEELIGQELIAENLLTPTYEIYKNFIDEKTNVFWKEMEQINIAKPTITIRVSDVIPQIENMISDLIDKEYAYESNGSVYFDTTKYYENFCDCELNNSTDDDISIKNTHNSDKKNNKDFALWKKGKPRHVTFNSKWGTGTVGWHIECSLMSSLMFQNNVDLHGGGIDLKFPHHHNEVLQSNSYYGISDVFKHFTYVGHVCKDGEKMAQSIGNYLRLEDYLLSHTANSLRLLFWLSPWYNPVELTDELIKQASLLDKRIDEFISLINYNLNIDKNLPLLNSNVTATKIFDNFDEIDNLLNNNFQTTEAIIKFNEIITNTNILIKNNLIDNATLNHILNLTQKFLTIVGYKFDTMEKNQNNNSNDLVLVEKLLQLRISLRKNGQYDLSDKIRDNIIPMMGYQIQDLKDGAKIKKINK